MRNEETLQGIRRFRHNPRYLSSVEINIKPKNLSTNLKETIKKADVVLLNVPTAFLKDALYKSG